MKLGNDIGPWEDRLIPFTRTGVIFWPEMFGS